MNILRHIWRGMGRWKYPCLLLLVLWLVLTPIVLSRT